MFALLRVLFILLVLGIGYCYWRERRSGDKYWRRVRSWLWAGAAVLALIMGIGLFVQRLLV